VPSFAFALVGAGTDKWVEPQRAAPFVRVTGFAETVLSHMSASCQVSEMPPTLQCDSSYLDECVGDEALIDDPWKIEADHDEQLDRLTETLLYAEA
jgi:hypothetical protein